MARFDTLGNLEPELRHILERAAIAVDDIEHDHVQTITAGASTASPGKAPTPVLVGDALIGLQMTVNNDEATRTIKLPDTYVLNTASFHIHWTKSTDTDDSGKNVRWRVTYVVFDGATHDVTTGSQTVEVDDTYEDSGTTNRIIYRTESTPFNGLLQPNYYVGFKVEPITPTGTALSEPVLINMDISFDKRVVHLVE